MTSRSICALFMVAAAWSPVLAQTAAPPAPAAPAQPAATDPFGFTDNSFLIEEAFNQEARTIQSITQLVATGTGDWAVAFTQEWPLGGMRHQGSFTIPYLRGGGMGGVGDVQLNYRFQALEEGPGRPAFAPRFSLAFPTGDEGHGFGEGAPGWQVGLPFSKRAGAVYFHANAGYARYWNVRAAGAPASCVCGGASTDDRGYVSAPYVAGSFIWATRPMVHVIVEAFGAWREKTVGASSERARAFTLSPGVQAGRNIGPGQLVLGAASPVTWTRGEARTALLLYLSWEFTLRR